MKTREEIRSGFRIIKNRDGNQFKIQYKRRSLLHRLFCSKESLWADYEIPGTYAFSSPVVRSSLSEIYKVFDEIIDSEYERQTQEWFLVEKHLKSSKKRIYLDS